MPPPGPSRLRVLDGAVVFWCFFWLVVGGWVGYEVWQLSRLGTSLAEAGRGLDDAGRALQELRGIPVIGSTPGAIGDEVRAAAQEASTRGQAAAGATRQLAVLLGLTTSLVPLIPVLWLYLPRRRAHERDVTLVRRLLGGDPREADGYLAARALRSHSYDELQRVSATPWSDYQEGRHRRLADLELARLGLQRTRP